MKIARNALMLKIASIAVLIAFSTYTLTHYRSVANWAGLSEAGPLPISLEEAPKLFKQCSRTAPVPEGPVWLPRGAEIRDLEQQLEHFFVQNTRLDDHLKQGQLRAVELGLDPNHQKYQAQFVGFERGGDKYIYASYLTRGLAKSGQNDEDAIILCDGGSGAWGIVYDLQTQELVEFSVNGGR